MCCGNKRNAFRSSAQMWGSGQLTTNPSSGNMSQSSGTLSQLPFEFRGAGSLTITGGATGKKYQFSRRGEVQLIDSRDRLSLSQLPVLKQLMTGKR